MNGITSPANDWESWPLRQRCRLIGRVAAAIAARAAELTDLASTDQRVDPVETITAELLPTCSALRFIARRGSGVLRTRAYNALGRPAWLWGVRSRVYRKPRGKVLVLGTWNYPIFLPGVQAAQALAAGNSVLLKPAVGCEQVTSCLIDAFYEAGVPESALRMLPSGAESAIQAIDNGVDLIVLTGASETGRKVLRQAAETVTPTIMELSGCDAVVVLPGADIARVADCIVFGLKFNAGATCIAPRRIIAEQREADLLKTALRERLDQAGWATVHAAARKEAAKRISSAISAGAVDVLGRYDETQLLDCGKMTPVFLDGVNPRDEIAAADLFAPITSLLRVSSIGEAIEIVNQCPYRLAVSIFGSGKIADSVAVQLDVGTVCINDLIVPTADPRLPFGGRGKSGFGVTRGEDGLLAMSVPATISRRHGKFAPHLQPRQPMDAQTLLGALQLLHARTLMERCSGLKNMIAAAKTGRGDGANHQKQEPQATPLEKENNS
ncbi:aldehyde dehydrogenase family protein [Rubripirellula sp.]|nr:aldehyde dehydrogenase family protein [Rubripirellula sp.]MDB4634857.1 aldehyde dehydrogenase family protein [Rubripirellula sp.]MDB4730180.1 aldehyde dehydrogenase family protein [bacterium]